MLCLVAPAAAMHRPVSTNPIQAYGRWLAETPADWPEAAVEAAHRAFIDIVGVTARGAAEAAPRRAFAAVGCWSEGRSSAIGMGARLSPPLAALVNGSSAHALEFDDNFDPGKAHATAVLAPAILALAEPRGASGGDCLDAYIAGLQILGRVGEALNPVHRNRGWHATATVGAIGAAAACARLLRLEARQGSFALSMATSMAGGFMSQFGTMTKPLHAGLAAQAGVVAASLAGQDVDAGLKTFDGPTGMTALMVGPDYESVGGLGFATERIGQPLLILDPGLKVKRFPNCASAHRAMDIILDLKRSEGFGPDAVETVTVRAPRAHLNNLMYDDPSTPLQAKFSLEFAVALIIAEGDCRLADFSDGNVGREDLRALYPRVRREPVDDAEGGVRTEVEIVLENGRRLAGAASHAVGSHARPFTAAELWAKFDGCVADLFSTDRAARLKAKLEALPELPSIEPLMRALGAEDFRPAAPSAC